MVVAEKVSNVKCVMKQDRFLSSALFATEVFVPFRKRAEFSAVVGGFFLE